MENRIMTREELKEITSLSTSNKQAEWFREAFGVNVVRSSDGRVIMTWATFQALLDKRAGITPSGQAPKKRITLVSDSKNVCGTDSERPALRPLKSLRDKKRAD